MLQYHPHSKMYALDFYFVKQSMFSGLFREIRGKSIGEGKNITETPVKVGLATGTPQKQYLIQTGRPVGLMILTCFNSFPLAGVELLQLVSSTSIDLIKFLPLFVPLLWFSLGKRTFY